MLEEQDWCHYSDMPSPNFYKAMREIKFKETLSTVSDHILNVSYDSGDLSDIGNEIGFAIGTCLENMTSDEISDLIIGLKHGISLTNGTH